MFWSIFLGFQLYLKKIPTQFFPCEICEMFKNTYFVELLQTAASVLSQKNSVKAFKWQLFLVAVQNFFAALDWLTFMPSF